MQTGHERRRFCLIAITLFAALPTAAQPGPEAPAIDGFFRGFFASHLGKDVGSVSLVVVRSDAVLFSGSLGVAREASRIEANPVRTVYQAGSNSKLFVATAALQLAEQGRLDLDADVDRYLRDLRIGSDPFPVTMAELLTHTSAIDDRKLGRTQAIADLPLKTLGQFFSDYPPHRFGPPGQELTYSGNAIAVAAHVVEAISGETFDAYAERHVFAPLRMTSSSFRQPIPTALRERRADMPDLPPLVTYPAGGLATTADDMGRFLRSMLRGGELEGGRILRPDTVSLLLAHHFPKDPSIPGIAYGFFEADLGGRRALVHTGDYKHLSILVLVPDVSLGWFLVLNPAGELRDPLLSTFATDFAGRFNEPAALPRAEEAKRLSLSSAEAGRFTGAYRDDAIPHGSLERFFVGLLFGDGDARVSFDAAKKTLFFQPPGAEALPLERVADHRFRARGERLAADLVFGQSEATGESLYVSAGPFGAYTFRRIPWFAGQMPQLVFLIAALLLFSAWLGFVVLRFVVSRFQRRSMWPPNGIERRLVWSATATAFFAAGGFALFTVLGLFVPSLAEMTGIPAAFYALPIVFTAASLCAVWLALDALRAWRARAFRLPIRVFFTLVAAVGVAFIPFCMAWKLLGLHL
jgi:CubicO group peptidase (beta-lactamase class C family)